MQSRSGRFLENEDGTVLIEAIILLPILTIFTFGLLEFGNLMWQRQQLQIGVRDAARYWARCRPTSNGATYMPCNLANARNIAFYGTPNPPTGASLRVPGWDGAAELDLAPATPPATPVSTDLVTAHAEFVYEGSPVFSAVFKNSIRIGYYHQTRYIGW